MSSAPADRIETLFHAALETPARDRDAFLSRVCGDDRGLRAELESLLAADSRTGLLIDAPAVAAQPGRPVRAAAVPLPPGRRIGSYELVRLIGAGGMGSVYEAVQDQPRRTVALKLLRASFATAEELRRFEHEVELLGRLQHPHIAQIFEAGVHADGLVSLPYFAMERIAGGQHLLDYVRAGKTPLRERLSLFLQVCEGVQHGHQRGVVHRDLKPSNILVDAAGRPRIIDYGVARALDAEMHTATMRASAAEFVGTLQYMAPEQLRANPAAIDTRCDIYALGLVLFELLTGRRPFDLSRSSWTAAIRTIETAPLPSAGTFARELRGDLSTIIAKATEKDRERRYASVGELAEDIRRHLHSEPIMARPASLLYHARKFAGRHRAFVAAVAVSMFSVLVGAGVAVWKAAEARAARERTLVEAGRTAMVRDFLEQMLAVGDTQHLGREVSMLAAIDAAAEHLPVTLESDPQVYGDLCSIIGRAYVRMRANDRALPHLRAAVEARRIACGDPSEGLARAIVDLAWVGCAQEPAEQARLFTQALEMYKALRGPDSPMVAVQLCNLAWSLDDLGRPEEAERMAREALARFERAGASVSDRYGYAQLVLGDMLVRRGRLAEAEPLYRSALEVQRQVLSPRHQELAMTLRRLARLADMNGATEEAERLRAEAYDIEPHHE